MLETGIHTCRQQCVPMYVHPGTAKWAGQLNISPTKLKILAQVVQFMHILNLVPPINRPVQRVYLAKPL